MTRPDQLHIAGTAALTALQDLGLAETLPGPSRAAEQRRVRLLPLR